MPVVADYRKLLFEIATSALATGPGYAQEGYVLGEAGRQLGVGDNVEVQQQVLDAWQDLFRNGDLAWGYDLNNPQAPFFHRPQ
jgi:hypothetical protein